MVVKNLPTWMDALRLLGDGEWLSDAENAWHATLRSDAAADVEARLRGLGFGGLKIEVIAAPPLSREWVREARAIDAKRRRSTTPATTKRGIWLDDEARFSWTPEPLAELVAHDVKGLTVVDAGCGAGSNAIAFATAGARVIAIELNEGRLKHAMNNAKSYGVHREIEFRAGDAVAAIEQGLRADMIFVDPPWGREWNHIETKADEFALLRIAEKALKNGQFRALRAKLPPSFDPTTLEGARAQAVFGTADGDFRRVKFVLVDLDSNLDVLKARG